MSRQNKPRCGSPWHVNDIILPKQMALSYSVQLQAGQDGKYPSEEPGLAEPSCRGINRAGWTAGVAPVQPIAPSHRTIPPAPATTV